MQTSHAALRRRSLHGSPLTPALSHKGRGSSSHAHHDLWSLNGSPLTPALSHKGRGSSSHAHHDLRSPHVSPLTPALSLKGRGSVPARRRLFRARRRGSCAVNRRRPTSGHPSRRRAHTLFSPTPAVTAGPPDLGRSCLSFRR